MFYNDIFRESPNFFRKLFTYLQSSSIASLRPFSTTFFIGAKIIVSILKSVDVLPLIQSYSSYRKSNVSQGSFHTFSALHQLCVPKNKDPFKFPYIPRYHVSPVVGPLLRRGGLVHHTEVDRETLHCHSTLKWLSSLLGSSTQPVNKARK